MILNQKQGPVYSVLFSFFLKYQQLQLIWLDLFWARPVGSPWAWQGSAVIVLLVQIRMTYKLLPATQNNR